MKVDFPAHLGRRGRTFVGAWSFGVGGTTSIPNGSAASPDIASPGRNFARPRGFQEAYPACRSPSTVLKKQTRIRPKGDRDMVSPTKVLALLWTGVLLAGMVVLI